MPNPRASQYPGGHGTAEPRIPAGPSTTGSPKGTTKPRLWPCLPFTPPHLPSAERVICILYVKEILLSPSPSPSLFW